MHHKTKLPLYILLSLILALIVGSLTPVWPEVMNLIGKSIIQLMKTFAMPYLFFMILISVQKADLSWKMGRRLITVATINAIFALIIGLTFSNIFKAGEHLQNVIVTPQLTSTDASYSLAQFVQQFAPQSLLDPFIKSNVLVIAILALLMGIALKKAKPPSIMGLEVLLKTFEKLLHWVLYLIPIAVFTVVGSSLHQYGFKPLQGLLAYLLVTLSGLFVHTIMVNGWWISRFAKIPIKKFFEASKETILYAFSVNSSLATLPLAMESLEELNVSPTAAAIGAGVGTNLNNAGIILYEAMGVLFIAQAQGIHLSLSQQLFTCLISLVAGVGIGGIPEAGFISLTIVATTVGVPTDLLPLLLTVDWIVARARSVVNIISDMTVSIAIDRMEKNEK